MSKLLFRDAIYESIDSSELKVSKDEFKLLINGSLIVSYSKDYAGLVKVLHI
jgi:hypothetical protein